MTHQEFINNVELMRKSQIAYFKSRNKLWLSKSIAYEKQVDDEIRRFNNEYYGEGVLDSEKDFLEQEGSKDYVIIDRKILFEICDAILNHYGYSDINDCPESDSECFWNKWNDDFRKKVENIRKNT